jgi:hypothetical protein
VNTTGHLPSFLVTAGGRLRAVPILHGRFEFAVEVRRAFAEHRPTDVVVELPTALADGMRRAVRRLPRLSVLRIETADSGERSFLLVEPADGLTEAVRLAMEHDLPLHCADRDAARVEPQAAAWPDPHVVETIGLAGWAAPCMAGSLRHEPAAASARPLAHKLTTLLADPERRVLFVCALPRLAPVLKRVGYETAVPFGRPQRLTWDLFHLHPDSSREVLGEMAWLGAAYERWRSEQASPQAPGAWPLPRHRIHLDLVRAARDQLEQEDGERIATPSLANLFRWARNISLLEGAMAPDFYTLVLAARGVGGDDFAWHVWNTASTWPWPEALDGLASRRVTLEDLNRSGRLLRFQRRVRRRRSALRLVRPRPREARPGEWHKQWSGYAICSHPPEDLVIEGYGHYLAHKARGLLAADRSQVEPFTVSLLDGIDFRETIRNRLQDGRIYVRRRRPARGRVGAVVLAFDPEDRAGRYPYTMTWQGEHDQESDMALYATLPGDRLVGPGISRCEYGGFLMTWPPGRMFAVWEDPEFFMARTPAERLLLAGIDYASERLVVYVAPQPPRSFVHQYAVRRDRKVLYMPIGQLSPTTLARLRVFHVLDGREVRAFARDYIG